MTPIFRFTALLLIPLLVRLPSVAQNATGLQIREIPESVNNNTLIVEVTDAQGAAVPDAAVTFRLPEDGPGGTFADGHRLAVVNTGHSGQARVDGIRWAGAGTVSVRITATKGTEHAGILVERQANIAVPAQKATGQIAETPKAAAPVASVPAASTTLKPAVQAQAAPPAPAKPVPQVAIVTKSPNQNAAVSKPSPQKSVGQPVAPLASQTTAAAVPPHPDAMPAIEPPNVSITSVARNQGNLAQTSSAAKTGDSEPNVSITGAGQRSHGGSKKWIVLALIAAGAGAGAAVMLSRGKSSSAASTASTAGVSIGAPTISIGAP